MRHRLENEIGGPAHDCQEKQEEQQINDSVFLCAQSESLSTSTDPNSPESKLERDHRHFFKEVHPVHTTFVLPLRTRYHA
jgi:hypothetical protein